MTGDQDDVLLTELASMFERLDPVPPHILAAAEAVPEVLAAWRALDAGLLEVVGDTALEPVPAGVRSVGGARLVSYAAGEHIVEVELAALPAGGFRLVGLVVPASAGELVVRHRGGELRAAVDGLGRFRAEPVAAGPVSLVLRPSGGAGLATDWITL